MRAYFNKICKLITITAITLLILTGCSNKPDAKVGEWDVYQTKVTKTYVKDSYWIVEGTTNAPDNSKILATNTKKGRYGNIFNCAAGTGEDEWGIVEKGKFKIEIDPMLGATNDSRIGNKNKICIVALSNYNKKYTSKFPSNVFREIDSKFNTSTFVVSKSQAKYFSDLKSKIDKHYYDKKDYNPESGDANAQSISYGELMKSDKYKDKSYHISRGKVLQADEKDDITTLLVYTDDNIDHLYYVVTDKDIPAVQDDYVDIKGIIYERQDYETNNGNTNIAPCIMVAKHNISVIGQ